MAGLCAFSGCSSPSPSIEQRCTDEGPAFRVSVLRSDGLRLPSDLRLQVTYGSGVEQYQPAQTATPKIVFCSSEQAPDKSIRSLNCELWTQGPAVLEIQSGEFPTLTRELTPDPKRCTRVERIDLMQPDGGTSPGLF